MALFFFLKNTNGEHGNCDECRALLKNTPGIWGSLPKFIIIILLETPSMQPLVFWEPVSTSAPASFRCSALRSACVVLVLVLVFL